MLKLKAFITKNEALLKEILRAVQSAMESCDENLEWVEKHSKELTNYLEKYAHTGNMEQLTVPILSKLITFR